MALDLQALEFYTDQNRMELVKRTVLLGRTMNLVNVVPDISSSASLNIIASEVVGANAECGWSTDGTTTELTQRDITVDSVQITESICPIQLEQYYTQKMLRPGSYPESFGFEEIYTSEKADIINVLVEDLIWKGNKATGVGNMALANGWLYLFDNELSASTVNGNVDNVSSITPSNIIAIVDGMAESVPTNILNTDDLVLFCGYDFYRMYATALRNANLFAYDGRENQGQDYSQMIPGTNIRIYAVRGINGTNRLVLTTLSNMVAGTSLTQDYEQFKLWFSMDNQECRFLCRFKIGTQVYFPDYVVNFKLA